MISFSGSNFGKNKIYIYNRKSHLTFFCQIEAISPKFKKLQISQNLKEIIPNRVDYHGNQILYYACQSQNGEICKFLFNSTYAINIKVNDGYDLENKPLHLAAKWNNTEATKLLISSGAKVNETNHRSQTPLFYAIKRNNIEISEILISNGADVNARDENSKTPLFYAIKQNNHEMVEFLISHGAVIDAEDRDALNEAAQNDSEETA